MTSSETSTLPKSYAILQSMQFIPRFSINAPSTLHHRSTKKFTSNSWSINGNLRFFSKKNLKKIAKPKMFLSRSARTIICPLLHFFAQKIWRRANVHRIFVVEFGKWIAHVSVTFGMVAKWSRGNNGFNP